MSEGDDPANGADEQSTDEDEHVEEIDPEEELPLSALRDRVAAERESAADDTPFSEVPREGSADTEESDLFEEVDTGDVDSEVVWDAVVEGDADPEDLLGEEPRTEPEAEPAAEPTGTPDEHVIDKREYCQRCEFFDDPPNATCTNEGTEIAELVDSDHFRVHGCPKVAVDDEALSGFASSTDSEE